MNNKYLKNVLLEKDFTEKNHDAIYNALRLKQQHRSMIETYGENNEDPQINEIMTEIDRKYSSEIFKLIAALESMQSRLPQGSEDQIAQIFCRALDSVGREVAGNKGKNNNDEA